VAFNLRQIILIAGAVVVVAAGGIYYMVNHQNASVLADAANAATPAAAANGDLMAPGPLGEMALGDPDAPNVVIEYASMTCSHCQRFHQETYRPFKEKYIDTGKVYFVFRPFPLDQLAAAATVLAYCAPKERFFPIIDLLFDEQDKWAFVQQPVPALLDLVKQAGFTEDSFKACLTNQTIIDGVNWVRDRAEKQFGVNSTPTFFINGVKKPGEQTLEELDKVLGG
jgi:protein-disulfide isomerase